LPGIRHLHRSAPTGPVRRKSTLTNFRAARSGRNPRALLEQCMADRAGAEFFPASKL
jgi:hypothetical protein